jgi:hypothetical protein
LTDPIQILYESIPFFFRNLIQAALAEIFSASFVKHFSPPYYFSMQI